MLRVHQLSRGPGHLHAPVFLGSRAPGAAPDGEVVELRWNRSHGDIIVADVWGEGARARLEGGGHRLRYVANRGYYEVSPAAEDGSDDAYLPVIAQTHAITASDADSGAHKSPHAER